MALNLNLSRAYIFEHYMWSPPSTTRATREYLCDGTGACYIQCVLHIHFVPVPEIPCVDGFSFYHANERILLALEVPAGRH